MIGRQKRKCGEGRSDRWVEGGEWDYIRLLL